MNVPILVEIKNLTFRREEREVFEQVSLTLQKGKITALLGPSGTGKTTLLQMIAGELSPQQGEVIFEGINLATLSKQELYAVRQRMGVLFQSGALFTDSTVFENVALPLRMHTNLPEALIRTLCAMKLEAVGLRGTECMMPAELSGGMARRVALARAIALDPEFLLFDEPFTGQDPITLAVLAKLIKDLNQALGLTVLVVSHDLQETLAIADHVYLLADGTVLAKGNAATLLKHSDPRVQQFVEGLVEGPVPFRYGAGEYHRDLFKDQPIYPEAIGQS